MKLLKPNIAAALLLTGMTSISGQAWTTEKPPSISFGTIPVF